MDTNTILNKELNAIIDSYVHDITKILESSNIFYLVNAGRMNHGKSSLLNSLIGNEKDIFEVQDKRTTVKNKEYKYNDRMIFIDTPGLNADDNDDKEALKAYKKANLILFVHNLAVGDLRKEEANDLQSIISCFNNLKSLEERFILVLTGKDSVQSQDDLVSIREKLLIDINKQTGLSEFKVFEVSNTTYKKGLTANKEKLKEHSGIEKLREYIHTFITENEKKNHERSAEKIDLATHNVKSMLEKKIDKVTASLRKKENEINKQLDTLNRILDSRFYLLERTVDKINKTVEQINTYKEDMADSTGMFWGGSF